MNPVQPIGAFDAKARLSELLRQVQNGQVFEISVRGRPVARLAPVQEERARHVQAATRMQDFMRAQASADAGEGVNLRELINEGRA